MPIPEDASSHPGPPESNAGQSAKPTPSSPNPAASRWRRRLRGLAIGGIILIAVGSMSIGGAEYYTAQPEFCGSCHIMDPYYTSWSHDVHGSRFNVRCVDCHYAPGEKFTIKAKLRGLSQLMSYVSGRAGAGRPRAHVSDASCLTSGCHGKAEYLTEQLPLGTPRTEKRVVLGREVEVQRSPTVWFAHDKHLQVAERLAETKEQLEQVRLRLHSAVSGEAFEQIQAVARRMKPAAERQATMHGLLNDLKLAAVEEGALELMRLEHAKTRFEQLDGLTCASCHGFDESQTRHLTVSFQTCYTCHFTNETFNQGAAACLRCHEPPVRSILVHQASHSAPDAPALMNHQEIVARGIDCASCHSDVVQGESTVTAQNCKRCHDQDRYLANFEERTTREVEEYHRVHVAQQRARCADCHEPVQHRLIDPIHVGTSASFIKPVLDDCQHCHPNHHGEQVQLLMGTGARGVHENLPNAMFGSRLSCRACHTEAGSDFKGAPLLAATKATCVTCHSSDYEQLFDQWRDEIAAFLKQAEELSAQVEQRIAELQAEGRPVPPAARELIDQARHDIHFIAAGNGIHNRNYALQSLEVAIANLRSVEGTLKKQ